jgi:hypothetical protein
MWNARKPLILLIFCTQVLTSIRNAGFGLVPSFDHAVGDPVEDDIRVSTIAGFPPNSKMWTVLISLPLIYFTILYPPWAG